MTASFSTTLPRAASGVRARRRPAVTTAVIFAALYGLAAAVGLVVIALIRQPLSEGSSYYVDVARNLVSGRGIVVDAIWSYATPPLTLPRPAFELWQPMASFVAAAPMAILGPSFNAAQFGFVLLGAMLAPLAWLVARDTATRLQLDARRSMTVEFGAAALTAISAPLLIATAAPDSTLPFAVLGVAACLLMPRAMTGERGAIVALGVTLGLAYLTRMEAVWLGIAFVVGSLLAGKSVRDTFARSAAVAGVAALVALPWWARNVAVFATPLPGQLSDNLFLTRNEQIFAYSDPASLAGFLTQGVPTILANVGAALWHDAVDVLLVAAGPVAVVGLATIAVALVRRRGLPGQGPLAMLLVTGAITFLGTSILFPVATLWGTFEHAAGPMHVALIVAAVIGMDAFVNRVRAWRSWPRSNSWLAPAALALATLPICALALVGAAHASGLDAQRIDQISAALPPYNGAPIITDRPVWLSEATGRSAIALPDEPIESLTRLAADFHAAAIVVTEPRGDYPAVLRTPAATACFSELSNPGLPAQSAVFIVHEACR
jgi:hypothetical protein